MTNKDLPTPSHHHTHIHTHCLANELYQARVSNISPFIIQGWPDGSDWSSLCHVRRKQFSNHFQTKADMVYSVTTQHSSREPYKIPVVIHVCKHCFIAMPCTTCAGVAKIETVFNTKA